MEGDRERRAPVWRPRGTIVEGREIERINRQIPQEDSSSQLPSEAEGGGSRDGSNNRSPFSFIEPRRYRNANGAFRQTATPENGLRFLKRRRHASTTSGQSTSVLVAERAAATDDSESSDSSDDKDGVDSSDDEDEDPSDSISTGSITASQPDNIKPPLPMGDSQTTALASTSTGSPGMPSPVDRSLNGELKGLESTADKVGVAIGVTIGTALIVFLIVFFILRKKYGPTDSLLPCINRRQRAQSRSYTSRLFGPVTEKSWSASNGSQPPIQNKHGPWVATGELGWSRVSFEKPLEKPNLESEQDSRPPFFVHRVPRAPLSSNPMTSPVMPSYYVKQRSESRYTAESETTMDKEPRIPAAVAHPENRRLTIGTTRSSEPESRPAGIDDQNPEQEDSYADAGPPPPKLRKPGVSCFSWSTAPTTPASATRSNRETVMTDDSEPPRFRSISSWVREQSKRQNNELSKHPTLSFLPPPIPESNPVTRYPPYPPTPPIPHAKRDAVGQAIDQTPASPGTPTSFRAHSFGVGIGVSISKPQRATFLSSSTTTRSNKHNRQNSSTTISTLPAFRQHPGEEIKIGRGTRVRSSSLRGLTQWS